MAGRLREGSLHPQGVKLGLWDLPHHRLTVRVNSFHFILFFAECLPENKGGNQVQQLSNTDWLVNSVELRRNSPMEGKML